MKAAGKEKARQAWERRNAEAPAAGSRTSKRLRRQNPDVAPDPESEPDEPEEELAAVDYDREWPVRQKKEHHDRCCHDWTWFRLRSLPLDRAGPLPLTAATRSRLTMMPARALLQMEPSELDDHEYLVFVYGEPTLTSTLPSRAHPHYSSSSSHYSSYNVKTSRTSRFGRLRDCSTCLHRAIGGIAADFHPADPISAPPFELRTNIILDQDFYCTVFLFFLLLFFLDQCHPPGTV